jgi:hypothetical protein
MFLAATRLNARHASLPSYTLQYNCELEDMHRFEGIPMTFGLLKESYNPSVVSSGRKVDALFWSRFSIKPEERVQCAQQGWHHDVKHVRDDFDRLQIL